MNENKDDWMTERDRLRKERRIAEFETLYKNHNKRIDNLKKTIFYYRAIAFALTSISIPLFVVSVFTVVQAVLSM